MHYRGWDLRLTTSQTLNRACKQSDAVSGLLLLLTYWLLIEAMPDVPRWFVLVILVAIYCLGHACFPLT